MKRHVKLFHDVFRLDPQDSESWSNLATGMLKLDRKRDAWQALKQATAGNYENWKIWQNYMFVCIDVGEFPEAIRSMKRIIDVLGEKNGEACLDVEVVEILVQRAVQDDPDRGEGSGETGCRIVYEEYRSYDYIVAKIMEFCCEIVFMERIVF